MVCEIWTRLAVLMRILSRWLSKHRFPSLIYGSSTSQYELFQHLHMLRSAKLAHCLALSVKHERHSGLPEVQNLLELSAIVVDLSVYLHQVCPSAGAIMSASGPKASRVSVASFRRS